jgi:hypothetical protein
MFHGQIDQFPRTGTRLGNQQRPRSPAGFDPFFYRMKAA